MAPPELKIPPHMVAQATDIYRRFGGVKALEYLWGHGFPIKPGNWKARMNRAGVTAARPDAWTPADEAFLREHYPDPTISMEYIQDKLGRTRWAVEKKAQSERIRRGLTEAPTRKLLVPQLTFSRPVLVLADMHVPFHDAGWINRVLDVADAWGVREAILAGDTIDAAAISRFVKGSMPDSSQEQDAFAQVEADLLELFERVHWSMGNHEARWAKRIDSALPLGRFIYRNFVQNRERVSVLDSYAVEVNQSWRIEHPHASGQNAAVDIAQHHYLNVAIAHTHHSDMRRDPGGRFYGIRIGAAADHTRMEYCTYITHGKWRMTQGALLLVPGDDGEMRPHLLEPDMDLRAVARMYRPSDWPGLEDLVGDEDVA